MDLVWQASGLQPAKLLAGGYIGIGKKPCSQQEEEYENCAHSMIS
jgi:hypothetical protein